MPDFEKKILDYVNRTGYTPVREKALLKKVGGSKSSSPEFEQAMASLRSRKEILISDSGLIRPVKKEGWIAGTIKKTNSGAGYLIPHHKPDDIAHDQRHAGDLYISERDLGDAQTGDEVYATAINRQRSGGQICGRVVEIIERASTTFVGTYFETQGEGYVHVDGKIFNSPIHVGDPGAKGVRSEDKVVIDILHFPSKNYLGQGVIAKVLGPHGKAGVDLLSIIYEFGIPLDFPEEVLAEAREQASLFDETKLGNRRDLTRETIVTIDPADARDFDDAISLTRDEKGHWLLGVHIADVAHFVKEGSLLDREAKHRGTSVYLPGRVIPMLPEIISNGLASLQEGQVRFTKSAFIEFTPEGIPVHTEFANTAIKVKQRFAYEQVLPIVQERDDEGKHVSAEVRELLKNMYQLAMMLRGRRFSAGALELHLAEVKLTFDDKHRVTGAVEREHDESHQIIEEFMLAANISIAEAFNDRGLRFLRRVHPSPEMPRQLAFAEFANALGFTLNKVQSRKDLQKLINEVHGTPVEQAINYALLRSLKQAEYTDEELGHYALAVDHYCHFTSPIRRYPDLTIHRMIDEILERPDKGKGQSPQGLRQLGHELSLRERRAESAERELTKVKLLTWMIDNNIRTLETMITGVETFGMFCRGTDVPVEGLLHISRLGKHDYFHQEVPKFSIVGERTGQEYRVGDLLTVEVEKIDLDRRELDFRLPRPKQYGKTKKKGSGAPEKRAPAGAAKSKKKESVRKAKSKKTRKKKRK
ncbi:ribonuclease R [Gimesia maris]|uniref:ribonuclease R n=1 Tax=Gimesia maris TaxID=122 RepID=UPI00241E0E76|nr:ribonuclease R [Gimesia maris]|tara:strand:+ start:228890 stop:231166 length:2277 start_codon:yes stop_codon:yes gene_type:complete